MGEEGKDGGEEITFRVACQRLRLSEKTLRKRLRAGIIPGRQVEGKTGKEWRVRLPVEAGEAPGAPEPPPGETIAILDEPIVSLALYRELLTRHEQAVGRLGYLQAQVERLPALEAGAAAREQELREGREREAQARARQARFAAWCGVAGALVAGLLAAVLWLLLR